MTSKEYASLLLRRNILKKFKDETSAEADAKALEKFLAANKRCKELRITCESWEDELVGTFKKVLYDFYLFLDDLCLLSYD